MTCTLGRPAALCGRVSMRNPTESGVSALCQIILQGHIVNKRGSSIHVGTVHMKERDPNSDFPGDTNEITFGKLGEDRLNIYIGMYFILLLMRGCTSRNSFCRSHTLAFSFHICLFLLSHTYSFLSHAYIFLLSHTYIHYFTFQ